MEEAIGLLSDTLPVAFFGGFFANFAKNRFFFHTKRVSKRTPTSFLVIVTLCNRNLEKLSCFPYIFAISVA